jgi:ATP-dependent RNA helicase RhlE
LLDLMQQNRARLDAVEIFVLDEADRMLDMGFLPAVKRIAAQLPARRQSLLFSATMPDSVRGIAGGLLRDPVDVAVARVSDTAENIEQRLCLVGNADKKNLLLHLLAEDYADGLVMVFMRMKHAAGKLAKFLSSHGVAADAIHGNKSQNARERALGAFRTGKVRVLVATDVASRGIDIKDVALVINYDLPDEAEAYIHRIGRTARAGASGHAIAFCAPEDRDSLRDIERLIKQSIPVMKEHPFAINPGAFAAGHAQPKPQPRPRPQSQTPAARAAMSRPQTRGGQGGGGNSHAHPRAMQGRLGARGGHGGFGGRRGR